MILVVRSIPHSYNLKELHFKISSVSYLGRRFDNVGADVEDLQVTSSMGMSMKELESDELKNKVSNLVPRGFQPLHLSPRRKGM